VSDAAQARLELLATALEAAVPLVQLELRNELRVLGRTAVDRTIARWAAEGADQVVSRGDILQFRGGKRGETAEVFAALARGLAALSTAPGGVTFAGRHWEMELAGEV
jgi:hypothetical protein